MKKQYHIWVDPEQLDHIRKTVLSESVRRGRTISVSAFIIEAVMQQYPRRVKK